MPLGDLELPQIGGSIGLARAKVRTVVQFSSDDRTQGFASALSLFEIFHNNRFFLKLPRDYLIELDLLFLDAFHCIWTNLPWPALGLYLPGNLMCHKLHQTIMRTPLSLEKKVATVSLK